MADEQSESRRRRQTDFVTNPTWGEMLRRLDEMKRMELERLQGAALGEDSSKVQQYAGMVKGIATVLDHMNRWREEILGPEHGDDV